MRGKLSRLQIYLLVALCALLFTSVWSYLSFVSIEQQTTKVAEQDIPLSNTASQLYPLMLDQELSIRNYVYLQDKLSLQQFEIANARMHDILRDIEELDQAHPIMNQLINEEAVPVIVEMEAFHFDQIKRIQDGDIELANELRNLQRSNLNVLRFVDSKIQEDSDAIITRAFEESREASNSARWMILFVSALTFLIFVAFVHSFRVEQSQKALVYKSLHDALTGIPNRRSFDERLEEAWRDARQLNKPLSLILIDIDAFKLYNDTYGHLEGDACLRKVAQVLRRVVKDPATPARYGGEEFAVILPVETASEARELAETIRQEILDLNVAHAGYHPLCKLTVSLGVSTMVPGLYESEKELIARADAALYQSKDKGRNRVTVNNIK